MAKRKKLPPRSRPRSLPGNHKDLANHIDDSITRDIEDRNEWNQMRIQRYAKLRGWREAKEFPWANASNAHIPYLATECNRTQDTMHNAILARHPVVEAMAVQQVNQPKQGRIDNLIDYQLFTEQQGEEIVAELVQQYVEDGVFLAYVPWVRYDESVNDVRIFPAIDPNLSVGEAVVNAMRSIFEVLTWDQKDKDGFTWEMEIVEQGETQTVKVEAYTRPDKQLELNIFKMVRAYDGPVVIPKTVDEWGVPWRSKNVQPPSASNPGGAEHVWLLDYPSLDEIRRLKENGYYDVVTDDDLDEIAAAAKEDPGEDEPNTEIKDLKDDLEGVHGGQGRTRPEEASGAGKLTRVLMFLGWDVNDDGLEEQVVVTMIRETKTILRVRYLTEQYPSDPPLRPLASAGYLPTGRIYAMSLIELLESLHDLMKITFDQMTDNATISNLPWFAYKPTSGLNPETHHPSPGAGIPMNDPQLLTQFSERASMQGAIQFGQVPRGKSSALRTTSNMQNVLAQGDARPERVMRRFFSGFKDIYRIMHELNQKMLSPGKQFRLMEPDLKTGQNVYEAVDKITDISGRMQFEFKAGMFNSDKATAQEVLQTLMQVLINPLFLQMGVVGPRGILNLLTEFIKLVQHEPSKYLDQPQQGPVTMQITAEEAVQILLMGRRPQGTTPQEGHEAHIKKITDYLATPEAAELNGFFQGLFQVYLADLQQQMAQQQQQQQMLQAAQQFQQTIGGLGQGGQPGPQAGPPQNTGIEANAPLGRNELADESLPGARGPQ
jgi:hypothetical protein